jgi:cytochrome bd-type quinol oxidase subunit 2
MCKILRGLEQFAVYSNTHLIVGLCIYRVLSFHYAELAEDGATKRRARYFIVVAWSLSGLCAIPQTFGNVIKTDEYNRTTCEYDYNYYGEKFWLNYLEMYLHIVMLYTVPITMIIASSTILLYSALKRMRSHGRHILYTWVITYHTCTRVSKL